MSEVISYWKSKSSLTTPPPHRPLPLLPYQTNHPDWFAPTASDPHIKQNSVSRLVAKWQGRHLKRPVPLRTQRTMCKELVETGMEETGDLIAMCYGRLAVMSDVDDGGFCPECRQQKVQDLDYVKVRTMEQCLWMIVARTHKGRMIDDERDR
jgi:hypothetical protein